MPRTAPPSRSPSLASPLMLGLAAVLVAGTMLPGCGGRRYDPARATRAYPSELPQSQVVDVQVFREGGNLIMVNATPQSFENFDIWVNRRYMLRVDRLEAGTTRRFWFGDFFDLWGETPVAGGFFRTERPTPAVLVQLQIGEQSPLLGVVSIPEEERF